MTTHLPDSRINIDISATLTAHQIVNEFLPLPEHIVTVEDFARYAPAKVLRLHTEKSRVHNEVVQLLERQLIQLPPHHATYLALICGELVEKGAAPEIAFTACCYVMQQLLARLEPFCAEHTLTEEDGNDAGSTVSGNNEVLGRWVTAQARLHSLNGVQKEQIHLLARAATLMIAPLMTMLMRSTDNHALFLQTGPLLALIRRCSKSDTLPLHSLSCLNRAADLCYENVAVILPDVNTGMLVYAHAISNTFHALGLLQQLMARHAEQLKIGHTNPAVLQPPDNTACYHWLNAQAYEHGELKNELALAWGESPLSAHTRKLDAIVLIALERDHFMQRSWQGFSELLHTAQQPAIRFIRYLNLREISSYLQ